MWYSYVRGIGLLAVNGLVGLCMAQAVVAEEPRLDATKAEQWANLVLKGVQTEFPNKLSLVYSNPDQIRRPRELFPAFHGCFDWHSSVHGHWVLVRLLREHPELPSSDRIRNVLNQHLTEANIKKEAAFFAKSEQKAFERMYGWSWLFRLAMELGTWDDPDAKGWRESLRPLESVLVERTEAYLPLLTYPIRVGQHTDTAFALGQILDYAKATDRPELVTSVEQKAMEFYRDDKDYPVHYEPSGHDFFSSCWNEADLMRRVLSTKEFEAWLAVFVPRLNAQLKDGTISAVTVSDASDGKIVHLAGLNLHRAWCMQSVAFALRADHPLRGPLLESSHVHLDAGLAYINSGHYEGDHWLATFGLYAIERVGVVDGVK